MKKQTVAAILSLALVLALGYAVAKPCVHSRFMFSCPTTA